MLKIAQKCPIFLLCLIFSNVREPSEPFLSNLERTEPVIKVSNRTNIEHRFEVHPPLSPIEEPTVAEPAVAWVTPARVNV